MDVAQEPGELDGKGSPEVGVDGPGTIWDGRGLRDEAGASGHLRADGCWGGQEPVPELVRSGAHYAGAHWGTVRADGPKCQNGRGLLGRNPGPFDSRFDERFHGGTQQPVLGREAQGPRVADGGIHDRHALLRHLETHP